MPVVYRCRRCGYVLYVHALTRCSSSGVPTPSEVAARYGGVCPRCGHRLGKPGVDDVRVELLGRPGTRGWLEGLRRRLCGGYKRYWIDILACVSGGETAHSKRSVDVKVRMSTEMYAELEELARKKGVSLSDALREAVKRFIRGTAELPA